MTSRMLSGLYMGQIAILDEDDYPMGTLVTPDAPTHGTVYSPYVFFAVVEANFGNPTSENAQSYAGMSLRGRRPLGTTDYGVGTLTMSEMDDVFDALVMGYTLDATTATSARIRAKNAKRLQQRRFMVALTAGATPVNSANDFETIVLLNVYFDNAQYGVNQSGGTNPNNVTYNMYVNASTRAPWGQLLSAATVAVDGDADTEMALNHADPYLFTTYVDDNSSATFTLPYSPSQTEVAGAHNIIFKEGVESKAQVSAINGTGNKTVNITAGADFARWVLWFPSTAAF